MEANSSYLDWVGLYNSSGKKYLDRKNWPVCLMRGPRWDRIHICWGCFQAQVLQAFRILPCCFQRSSTCSIQITLMSKVHQMLFWPGFWLVQMEESIFSRYTEFDFWFIDQSNLSNSHGKNWCVTLSSSWTYGHIKAVYIWIIPVLPQLSWWWACARDSLVNMHMF